VEDKLPLFSEELYARLQAQGTGETLWGVFDYQEP
jgi:hypothetical protein